MRSAWRRAAIPPEIPRGYTHDAQTVPQSAIYTAGNCDPLSSWYVTGLDTVVDSGQHTVLTSHSRNTSCCQWWTVDSLQEKDVSWGAGSSLLLRSGSRLRASALQCSFPGRNRKR